MDENKLIMKKMSGIECYYKKKSYSGSCKGMMGEQGLLQTGWSGDIWDVSQTKKELIM